MIACGYMSTLGQRQKVDSGLESTHILCRSGMCATQPVQTLDAGQKRSANLGELPDHEQSWHSALRQPEVAAGFRHRAPSSMLFLLPLHPAASCSLAVTLCLLSLTDTYHMALGSALQIML